MSSFSFMTKLVGRPPNLATTGAKVGRCPTMIHNRTKSGNSYASFVVLRVEWSGTIRTCTQIMHTSAYFDLKN